MEKNIAVIWGDCSSPEIVKQTIRVLDKVAEKYGHTFHYTDAAMGGEAIDKYGDPLPLKLPLDIQKAPPPLPSLSSSLFSLFVSMHEVLPFFDFLSFLP